jgi:hypothetical protein
VRLAAAASIIWDAGRPLVVEVRFMQHNFTGIPHCRGECGGGESERVPTLFTYHDKLVHYENLLTRSFYYLIGAKYLLA